MSSKKHHATHCVNLNSCALVFCAGLLRGAAGLAVVDGCEVQPFPVAALDDSFADDLDNEIQCSTVDLLQRGYNLSSHLVAVSGVKSEAALAPVEGSNVADDSSSGGASGGRISGDGGTGSGVDVALIVAKAYYINMNGSVDRRSAMEDQLAALQGATGLPFQRFPGINGTTDPWVQSIVQKNDSANPAGPPQVASVACLRAHVSVWRSILATADQSIQAPRYSLVLEDDAVVYPDGLDTLSSRLADVPEDHDMVLLGFWGSYRESDEVGSGVYRANAPFAVHQPDATAQFFYGGAHAYLVRHQSLPRMIALEEDRTNHNNATPTDRCWNIDCDTAYNVSGIRKYALLPMMASTSGALSIRVEMNNDDLQ